MAPVTVQPQTYYDAATSCTGMATDVDSATDTLVKSLADTGSMSGSYPAAMAWGKTYDTNAGAVVDNARKFVDALNHFAGLLNQAGYNHALANYNATIGDKGTRPDKPADPPGPRELCWVSAPAAGGPGKGLDTNIPGLLSAIGIPVPDGDTDKLGHAADAWNAFANNHDVSTAQATLKTVSDGFSGITAPEVPDLQQRLGQLQSAAGDLTTTAAAVGKDAADHKDTLSELRHTLDDKVTELGVELGITIAAGILATWLTAGISDEAAAAGGGAEITAAGVSMASAIRSSRLIKAIEDGIKAVKDMLKTSKDLDEIADLEEEDIEVEDPEDSPPPTEPLPERPPEVPSDWTVRRADNDQGWVWQKPGSTGNQNMFRDADPNAKNPDGYVRFYNDSGQPVDINGKPGPNSATHIPKNPDGTYPIPKGWPN